MKMMIGSIMRALTTALSTYLVTEYGPGLAAHGIEAAQIEDLVGTAGGVLTGALTLAWIWFKNRKLAMQAKELKERTYNP